MTAAPSSPYPGFVAGQLCLRLARLPPDRTETVGVERAPLPLLELCMCMFAMYYHLMAETLGVYNLMNNSNFRGSMTISQSIVDKYSTVFNSLSLPPSSLGHPPPTTSSIARRLYDSPTWPSEGRASEDRKTRER